MRLDKYLCEMNIGTRSQVKDFIRKGLVTVNGNVAKKPEDKISEDKDIVTFKGETLQYQQFYYYMLNKPQGVVSATKDNLDKTVLDLIKTDRTDIFPVGRLDKDTEGLLLLTNDGELAHNMLSPRKHVEKTYLVTLKKPLRQSEIETLEQGVDIGDDKPTLPAKVDLLYDISPKSDTSFQEEVESDLPTQKLPQIYLTIKEGRFHQVKRMLKAVDNEVLALKRVRFGALFLDKELNPGEYRELTNQEVALLHETKNDA